MTPEIKLRDRGEAAKLLGMELAANARIDRVSTGKIALLRALLCSPDGTATIDDATTDLAEQFGDGGRWRGSVCRSLAMAQLIERVGVEKSERPSRHRGYITRWLLVDRREAQLALSRLVAAQDCRIGLASDMPDTSPINKETPPGATDGVSVQSTLPGFDRKESNHGHIN